MENDFEFLPSDYKLPVTSKYMKFAEGENTFRVLSSAITGWEYFTSDNKPIRSQVPFDEIPTDIKKDGVIKAFWAFVVYNFEAKQIQILELTQKSIMKTIQAYTKNPKWGSPKNFDIIVTRSGSGLDTEYAVSVNPKSELDEKITESFKNMTVNLNALYDGSDPYTTR